MGRRFWTESALGGVSALLLAVTLVWHDWLELVFGADPDHGSGAVEWAMVAVTAVIALTCLALARSEWRRVHAVAA